eukprot:maker-scaffold_5-snap-gene-7.6-mRNA-1 protein AED:0.74 eAED:0.94 QI:0/0/0/1/0/0/2/0/59
MLTPSLDLETNDSFLLLQLKRRLYSLKKYSTNLITRYIWFNLALVNGARVKSKMALPQS